MNLIKLNIVRLSETVEVVGDFGLSIYVNPHDTYVLAVADQEMRQELSWALWTPPNKFDWQRAPDNKLKMD